ncbi:protein psiN-like isoform X2 [Portunus trituberculatus]|uniref:protein psiN-like isoform X2 n=1 Tax=Portunus trituberculatus TaxID=210409 RepID=UPI001E1CB7B0|nr:protein psiN-like isoform X2 [Portunus trituberculatus]
MKTLLAVVEVVLVVLVSLPCCLPQAIHPRQVAAKEDQSAYAKHSSSAPCLPEGKCQNKYGGFCFNSKTENPMCDGVLKEKGVCSNTRDPMCSCCINCLDNPCNPEGKGKKLKGESFCRKECMENEYSVSKCNLYCQCCVPCIPTKCMGRCVNHPDLCVGAKEYIEGVCTGNTCACCVTCEPDPDCKKSGGQCVASDEECPCGFQPSLSFGCNSGNINCKCCTPCPNSKLCSSGIEAGICVPNNFNCNGHDEYISDDACCQRTCSCCKTCQPDKLCEAENGNCYKKEIGCGPGMMASIQGKCTSDNCVCCIPEQCPKSCNCIAGPNPGRCVAEPYILKANEYLSGEKCIGPKCSCYKTCTPDEMCSTLKGICFNIKDGCDKGLTLSDKGSCNSKNCICCVKEQVSCEKTDACTYAHNIGRCEFDMEKCSSPYEYISDDTPCNGGKNCFCCKTCYSSRTCTNLNGNCYPKKAGCPKGLIMSEYNSCSTSCICCIPI